MIQINKKEEPKPYTVFCVSPATSGHSIPLLKVAAALSKRGHRIVYATSEYAVQKNKKEYPHFEIFGLKEATMNSGIKVSKIGPPLELFYETWLPDLRKAYQEVKPDIVLVDFFSVAAIQVAEEMKIKLIINVPLSSLAVFKFGLPNLANNFGMLGITVVKPNFFSMFLQKMCPLIENISDAMSKHLVLVHSFVGLDAPLLLPPHVKLIGLPIDTTEPKQIEPDLSKWLEYVRKKDLKIIYVTFGSILEATKEFVDHMYYGLKKTGMAIIWGLRTHTIPEQNELFYVKEWLPQKDLLMLKEVKVVITHCGFGGLTDTINAEKPILCIPVFGDQPYNAQMVQKQGLGLILRKSPDPFGPKKYIALGFTHQELIEKLNTVINDVNYELKVKRIKQIGLRSGNGIETACDWVEYVGDLGYDHLIDNSIIKVSKRNPFTWIKRILFTAAVAGGVAYYFYKNPLDLKSVVKTP